MKAKDTVMSPIEVSRRVKEIVALSPNIGEAGVNIKIAEDQTEISFKAGMKEVADLIVHADKNYTIGFIPTLTFFNSIPVFPVRKTLVTFSCIIHPSPPASGL